MLVIHIEMSACKTSAGYWCYMDHNHTFLNFCLLIMAHFHLFVESQQYECLGAVQEVVSHYDSAAAAVGTLQLQRWWVT